MNLKQGQKQMSQAKDLDLWFLVFLQPSEFSVLLNPHLTLRVPQKRRDGDASCPIPGLLLCQLGNTSSWWALLFQKGSMNACISGFLNSHISIRISQCLTLDLNIQFLVYFTLTPNHCLIVSFEQYFPLSYAEVTNFSG